MILIFDSSPLIVLGRVKILEKVEKLKTVNLIPKAVYNEVILHGKLTGKEDALYIERLIQKEIFKVIEVKNLSLKFPSSSLSQADQEVLSLSKEKNAYAVIDEDAGRSMAELLGIKAIESAGILFNLLDAKILSKEEAKELLNEMVNHGWYCSPTLYSYILNKLQKR